MNLRHSPSPARDKRPPRTGPRVRMAVIAGLVAGSLWTLTSDRTAHTQEGPPPEPPKVVALAELAPDAPLKQRLAPHRVASAAPAPTPESDSPATWAIPAGAIDPRNAVRDGDHLVQDLPDGTRVTFTLDPKLQAVAQDTLSRYDVEWGAVVAIRVDTGEVLAMAEHAKGRTDLSRLALSAQAPAASVFKIITSASLLENAQLTPDERICTHGGSNKLTLYNLKPSQRLDTKCETFAEALGSSNNVAFARWADQHLTPQQLQATADRFLFGRRLPFPWAVGISQARIPFGSRLGFARSAAGFEGTTLSPLHAAMITAAVGHEGKMMVPNLIASARHGGETVYEAKPTELAEVLAPEHARTLTAMLESTVTYGTGKKFFEKKGVSRLGRVRAGGKSGSLSGTHEETRRHFSWFVALAPIEKPEVAVAALVVHGDTWTVKGAVPAREVLAAYFDADKPNPRERDPLAE